MTEQKPEEKKARRVELTPRDIRTLKWAGEQYAAGLDQIAKVLGEEAGPGAQTPGILSESATRTWATRMKAVGAIEQDKPYKALPAFVWLTRQGLELAGLDYKAITPKPSTLNHLYWCNQARLFMARERASYEWISERRLRSEHAQATTGQHKAPELPDAHLKTPQGIIALEIELTDKQAARLVALVRRRATEYYTVWYFCSDEAKPRVEAAKTQLAADVRDRIQVYSLRQLE